MFFPSGYVETIVSLLNQDHDHDFVQNLVPNQNQLDTTCLDCMVPIDGITDEGGLQILNFALPAFVDLTL